MPEEIDPNADLPELTSFEAVKLGLEIDALEHGISPDKEFARRMKIGGAHVASTPEHPRATRIVNSLVRLIFKRSL
jgi:hypothetical protein